MKNKFLFTAGIVGMLSGVASGATDRANKGWFSECRPYMVLRGGWQFGKAEPGISLNIPPNTENASVKKSLKNAWAGSFEFGTARFEDRLLCGVEFGYFTGKFKFNEPLSAIAGATVRADGDIENFFAVGNVTLLRDFGERAFLYGGIGAGIVRSRWFCDMTTTVAGVTIHGPLNGSEVRWRFLSQAFAGIGVDLNENWSLSVGYRLRYVHGKFHAEGQVGGVEFGDSMKQNIIHAAEIGLTYQF